MKWGRGSRHPEKRSTAPLGWQRFRRQNRSALLIGAQIEMRLSFDGRTGRRSSNSNVPDALEMAIGAAAGSAGVTRRLAGDLRAAGKFRGKLRRFPARRHSEFKGRS